MFDLPISPRELPPPTAISEMFFFFFRPKKKKVLPLATKPVSEILSTIDPSSLIFNLGGADLFQIFSFYGAESPLVP